MFSTLAVSVLLPFVRHCSNLSCAHYLDKTRDIGSFSHNIWENGANPV